MSEFTLLKVQFDDATFAASAPFGGEAEVEADGDETEAETEEGPGALLALFVGLVFLAALAFAARKLRGGEQTVDVETDP